MPVKEIIKNRKKKKKKKKKKKQKKKKKKKKKKTKKLPTKTIGQNTSKCFWNNETTLVQQKNYQLGQITWHNIGHGVGPKSKL